MVQKYQQAKITNMVRSEHASPFLAAVVMVKSLKEIVNGEDGILVKVSLSKPQFVYFNSDFMPKLMLVKLCFPESMLNHVVFFVSLANTMCREATLAYKSGVGSNMSQFINRQRLYVILYHEARFIRLVHMSYFLCWVGF